MQKMNEKPVPFPYRDPELNRAVLEASYREYPERKANCDRYLSVKRSEVVDYMPTQLDVENVSRCNYHCTMCQVSGWPNSKRAADMTLEDFKKLIDEQPGLLEVKIQGMGEPFLGGEVFFEMIRYARKKHLWVRSSTNASILHLNENYKKVLDADICELQVSVDGTTPETYAAIRRGGDLERVRRNCILLNDYGRQTGRKRTRMWTLLQKRNIHELEKFPVFAGELGFERLTLARDLNAWGQEYWEKENSKFDIKAEFDFAVVDSLVDLGKAHGVEVTFWYGDEKYDPSNPEKLCPLPFQRAYISSDMRICPCNGYGDPALWDLGDATRLPETWNGPEMVEFRRAHLTGDIPRFCRACYNMPPLDEPEDK